jgi:putative component of membrane protein insertase Oxa1/YidC/SpoIIIJ protein YidD
MSLSLQRSFFTKGRLAVLLIVAASVLLIVDTTRPPSGRLVVCLAVSAITGYQHHLSPKLSGWVHCRYSETCSVYAKRMLTTHGLFKGSIETYRRLKSCDGTSMPREKNEAFVFAHSADSRPGSSAKDVER